MSLAQSFAKTGFAKFINTTTGRLVRIIAGLILIIWGFAVELQSTAIILIVIGLIPLAAGLFNMCVISGLLGGPLSPKRMSQSIKPE